MARTVDELLAEARQRLRRLDALDASARVSRGALLIDTRPEWQRREHGSVPGALVIDRNHCRPSACTAPPTSSGASTRGRS